MSGDDAVERGWRAGLVGWIGVACVLMWVAPAPPPVPIFTAEEVEVWDRTAREAGENARTWQLEHGDLKLPWDVARGHLAIVIDDVGRELHLFEQLLTLRHPITFSVLPGSNYAVGVQLRLRKDGRRYREILAHIPMEPLDARKMDQGLEVDEDFLRQADDPNRLRTKLNDALARIPTAIGVNNHMGSSLTVDDTAMEVVMQELRSRGLLFLDSRTTAESVAAQAARRHNVPMAVRHVFLDNDPRAGAVRAALADAARRALNEPTVVLAHPLPAVVEVLRQELPRLHGQKIAVYPLSELVAHSPTSPPHPLAPPAGGTPADIATGQ